MNEYRWKIESIDCAACAEELEEEIGKIAGVHDANIEFGVTSLLTYRAEEEDAARIETAMKEAIIEDQGSQVKITAVESKKKTMRYRIESIDCAACAEELEEEIGKIEGVSNSHIEFGVQSVASFDCTEKDLARIEEKMREIIIEDQGENTKITRLNGNIKHVKYTVESIDCAACAEELEEEIGKIEGVENAKIEFGITSVLTYDVEEKDIARVEKKMREIIVEDQGESIVITRKDNVTRVQQFDVVGIDCAACTDELAEEIAKIDGISDVHMDFGITSRLRYSCDRKDAARIEKEMRTIILEDEKDAVITKKGEREKNIAKEEKEDHSMLYRLIIGAALFVVSFAFSGVLQSVAVLIAYVILGYDVIVKAFRNIGRGQFFDEHFLMTVATFAAIYLHDFKEAAGVMLFYQIGEYFQDRAVAHSRKSIGELMDIRPDHAYVKMDEGYEEVDPEEVVAGDIIRVKPGERIPLDGIVVRGASSLDTSSLTGEAKPIDVDVNSEVMSGTVNQTGVLEIRVTKEYGESTVAKILDLVENNESHKAGAERFITKFSKYYTPIVVFAAIAVAIIVAILTHDVNEGIERACTFLVISCPCALVISIPLSFFAGIGGLSGRGVLVKGADVIESLVDVDQIVMDKTGTLTTGKFAVDQVLHSENAEETIAYAAMAEHFSNHPIAEGIKNAYGKEIDESRISDVEEIAGRGLKVTVDGEVVYAGNARLMRDEGIVFEEEKVPGTLVYVGKGKKYLGCLVLKDQVKSDAKSAVEELHKAGKKVYIVSGDNKEITAEVAKAIGADGYYGECLPEEKVATVKKIKENGKTAFVGDGVNDAPVLALSDVSFAMGALGSDAAIEAADVVLMDDAPSKIALTMTSAKRTLRIAKQNIYGAIGIKIFVLILGALGFANMWMAIFADTGVAMLCVLNAMRLLRIAQK